MKIKFIFLLLFVLLVNGCKKKISDPLYGLVIGSSESIWKEKVKSLVSNKSLTCVEEGKRYYGCLFDSVFVNIELNTEFNFGKLLDFRMRFALRPDLYNKSRYQLFPLSMSYKTISDVFSKMKQLYGEPDSIIKVYTDKYFKYENFTGKPLIDSLIGGFISIWKEKEYDVFFDVGKFGWQLDSADSRKDYVLSMSEIRYQHPNYKSEIKLISDSIIAGYKISDYIKSEVDNPSITSTEFDYSHRNREVSFQMIMIDRVESLDSRGIISVLTDVVFYDNFENELARFEDVEFEFGDNILLTLKRMSRRVPNESHESLSRRATYENNRMLILNKTFKYYSGVSAYLKLESAYQKGTTIRTKLDVKAIKFDDSSVLKKMML
jgi:hypothetical protein